MTDCVRMVCSGGDGSDGMFGRPETWREDAPFRALIAPPKGGEGRAGERPVLKDSYAVVTARGVGLRYGDVFRRVSDGVAFRVVGPRTEAPDIATPQLEKVEAERWVIPE